jgi:FixJ family two-component response regulator
MARHPPQTAANTHFVLIVDDDHAVRDSLKFALELEGLLVDTCESGNALLGHPRLQLARCLVLDHQMPGMNGFAVMHELKRRNVCLPIIMITAPLSREIEQRALAAGVVALLEKPLLEDVLLDKIRRIL